MERKQFTFYRSFYDGMKTLKKNDRLAVYDAIVFYGLFGYQAAKLTELQQGFFNLIIPTLDASAKKAANAMKAVSKRSSKQGSKKEKESEIEFEIEKESEIESEIEGDSLYSAPAPQQTDFLSFWDKYPNKLDREEALAEWQQVATDETVANQILDGLQAWKKTAQWKQDGGRFVPTAANFLKRGYWNVKPPKGGMDKKGNPSCTLGEAERENIRRLMQETI